MTKPFIENELQLVDAIHDAPADDKPRLAYADWLQREGCTDLAAFIRIQCMEPDFSLDKQGNQPPGVSHDGSGIQFSDPARAERAMALLTTLHPTDRFPDVRFWQEYTRGLPLYECKVDDDYLACTPIELLLGTPSPLARFRVLVTTSRLADWLAHPIMRFVDVLRIFPEYERDVGPREFTASEIHVLANFPNLNRFHEVGLCGPVADTARALAKDLLETRVFVSYDY